MRPDLLAATALILGGSACLVPPQASEQSLHGPVDSWHQFQPDLPVSQPPFRSIHANWKQRIDQPYVYVEFQGSYTETGRLLPQVHRAMVDQGLEPAGPPFALFYDDPGTTPVEQLRSRACVPVEDVADPQGELDFDVLPSTTVVYAFVAGAYPDVPRSYPGIYAYLGAQGWVENGPIRETYLVAPESVESFDALLTEVQVPVTYGN